MARARFRRKDLKRPDEFVSRGRNVVDWARAHNRLVGQVLGAVLVVTLGIAGVVSVRGARTRQANEDLARALAEYEAGHYTQAATQLADVAGRWRGTVPGNIAQLLAASADLSADNVATATVALQEAVTFENVPPYLKQQSRLNLAQALERSGDAQGAAGRYAETAGLDGPYTATALLGEARLRDQLGDSAAARRIYERILNEFSQSADIDWIKAKIGPPSA